MEIGPPKAENTGDLGGKPYSPDEPSAGGFPAPAYHKNEKWVLNYIEQFGEEPSFY